MDDVRRMMVAIWKDDPTKPCLDLDKNSQPLYRAAAEAALAILIDGKMTNKPLAKHGGDR